MAVYTGSHKFDKLLFNNTYTVATMPTVSEGQIIYVTDGVGLLYVGRSGEWVPVLNSSLDGYLSEITFQENKNYWNEAIYHLRVAADGYAGGGGGVSETTFQENKNYWNEAISQLRIASDGYAGGGGGVSETTFQENKNYWNEAIYQIKAAADGYAKVTDLNSTGDGYIVFFTGIGNNIAGDNDLYWNRETNTLQLGGSITPFTDNIIDLGTNSTGRIRSLYIGTSIISGTNTFTKTITNGDIIMDNGTADSPGIKFYSSNNVNQGIDGSTSGLRLITNLDESGGAVRALINTGGLGLRGDNILYWVSGILSPGVADTGLSRNSAGVVKITDGATGYGNLTVGRILFQNDVDLGQTLDGYDLISVSISSGAIGDGYIAFFNGDNKLAGDNDLYWDRTNNNLVLGNNLAFNGRSVISSPSDSNILLTNNAGTAFGNLYFGDTQTGIITSTVSLGFALSNNARFQITNTGGAFYWDTGTGHTTFGSSVAVRDAGLVRQEAGLIRISNGSTGYGNLAVGRIIFQNDVDLGQTLDGYALSNATAGGMLTGTYPNPNLNTNARRRAIPIQINGGGSVIPASPVLPPIAVPWTCTVTGWQIVADAYGSIVVDIQKVDYASYPTGTSIAGTEKPTLSSEIKNQDLSISTWTDITLEAGEFIQPVVEGTPSTVKAVTVIIYCTLDES